MRLSSINSLRASISANDAISVHEGSLPEEWYVLNFTYFSVSKNYLNGTVPTPWGTAWPYLWYLDLSYNVNISGAEICPYRFVAVM